MLDRGEQLGWFGSAEIVAELIISIVGFYYFFAHSLTTAEPFVRFAIFQGPQLPDRLLLHGDHGR